MAPASPQRPGLQAFGLSLSSKELAALFKFFKCSPLPCNWAQWYFGKIPEDHTAPLNFDLFSGLDHTAAGGIVHPHLLSAKARNKLRRAINGNTALVLDQLIPHNRLIISLERLLEQRPAESSVPASAYSRSFLLQCRPLKERPPGITGQITTQPFTPSKPKHSRTGRRIKIRPQLGTVVFSKKTRPHRLINGIQEQHNSNTRRKPPPRGAPGPPHRRNEEFSPTKTRTQTSERGPGRARRRRAYRRWMRGGTKVWMKEPGPPHPVPSKPQHAAHTRAQWFKQNIHWQEQMKRNKKRKSVKYPNTPPLPYGNNSKLVRLMFRASPTRLSLKPPSS